MSLVSKKFQGSARAHSRNLVDLTLQRSYFAKPSGEGRWRSRHAIQHPRAFREKTTLRDIALLGATESSGGSVAEFENARARKHQATRAQHGLPFSPENVVGRKPTTDEEQYAFQHSTYNLVERLERDGVNISWNQVVDGGPIPEPRSSGH